jgi:hypothetical protein
MVSRLDNHTPLSTLTASVGHAKRSLGTYLGRGERESASLIRAFKGLRMKEKFQLYPMTPCCALPYFILTETLGT